MDRKGLFLQLDVTPSLSHLPLTLLFSYTQAPSTITSVETLPGTTITSVSTVPGTTITKVRYPSRSLSSIRQDHHCSR